MKARTAGICVVRVELDVNTEDATPCGQRAQLLDVRDAAVALDLLLGRPLADEPLAGAP